MAKLEDAVGVLEDIVADLLELVTVVDVVGPTENQVADEADDPLEVALSVVASASEEADAVLEGQLAEWLGEDPEYWSVSRLSLLNAWRDGRGSLDPAAPGGAGFWPPTRLSPTSRLIPTDAKGKSIWTSGRGRTTR